MFAPLLAAPQARADCSGPDGIAGDMVYNTTYDVFQGCTANAGWVAFHEPAFLIAACTSPWGGPDINHGNSVTAYETASVPYGESCNDESRTCDNGDLSGTYEHESCAPEAQDTTPEVFAFTHQTDVALNSSIESNTVTITGISGSVAVAISGEGSPQFRIAGGSWTTSGNIENGQTLQLRLTSANAESTARSATVTVGTVNEGWSVTTQDLTPNSFSFTDQTDVALNTTIQSNIVTINGITGSVAVSISGDGSPQFRIAGGSWTTSGTITNGQTLQLRLTSANAHSTQRTATVTVGNGNAGWSVTTIPMCGGGAQVGDHCWYYGSNGQSCTQVCSDYGKSYHTATRDYAGSHGTNANCMSVLDALNVPYTALNYDSSCSYGAVGCTWRTLSGGYRRRCGNFTTSGAADSDTRRACACE